MDISALVGQEVFAVLLIFCRIGAAFMVMPAIGESYVLSRLRLLLAFAVSLLLAAPLAPVMPALPDEPADLAWLVALEVVVGLFLGLTLRLAMTVMHFGGAVLAMQSGLSAASMFDPNEASQGTIFGNLLTTLGLVLIVASDTHLLLLKGLSLSYAPLAAGADLPAGDMAQAYLRLLGIAVAAGLKLAAPLIVVGFALYLLMGLLNRLMPSLQVMFVIMPVQIITSLVVILLCLGFTARLFLDTLGSALLWLDVP